VRYCAEKETKDQHCQEKLNYGSGRTDSRPLGTNLDVTPIERIEKLTIIP
jgi:hypothetical protein